MESIHNFKTVGESFNDKPKSNFGNYTTGITSIKIKENKKVDLKKLKTSNERKNSGISPTRDIEDLKRIEKSKNNKMKTIETEENENDPNKNILKTKKKLISAKNDILKDALNGENKESEEVPDLRKKEKNGENKTLSSKAKRIIEKNRTNINGNFANKFSYLNDCDDYNKIDTNESKTAKSYHNSKMQKLVEKFSEKTADKNRKDRSPFNDKGRNLIEEILSGKISGNVKNNKKEEIRKTTIDDDNYDLDEFIQKEIFKFSENNSSKRNTPNSTNNQTKDKNTNNLKKENKVSKYENDKDKMMDLSMDRSFNDIAKDNLKDKLNKQKEKSIKNALNKTGDLVNLDDNDNSIIDQVFSQIEGKSKKRRKSGYNLGNIQSIPKNKESNYQENNFNIKDLIDKDDNNFNSIPKVQNKNPLNKQSLSTKGIISAKSTNLNSERENLKKNLLMKKNEVLENAFNDDDGKFNSLNPDDDFNLLNSPKKIKKTNQLEIDNLIRNMQSNSDNLRIQNSTSNPKINKEYSKMVISKKKENLNKRLENTTPEETSKEKNFSLKREKKPNISNNNDLIYSKELIKEKRRKKNFTKDYGNMEKNDNSQVDFHQALDLLEQANQSKNQIPKEEDKEPSGWSKFVNFMNPFKCG